MKSALRMCGFALTILALGVLPVAAQDWGKITDAEWEMGPPPGYSALGAVVIFDAAQATAELKGLELERHCRMKVFTEEGAEGVKNLEIEYFEYDHLHDFKALIHHPDGSTVKFDKKDFEITKKGVIRTAHFTFPNVQSEDILEFRYKIDYYGGYDKLGPEKYFLFSQQKRYSEYQNKKDYGGYDWDDDAYKDVSNLPTWYFDHPVFCLKSSFAAKLGSDLDYAYFTTNVPIDKVEPVSERIKFITATLYKKHTWELVNVKPFGPDTTNIYDDEVERCGIHFALFSTVGQNRVLRLRWADKHFDYLGRSFQGYLSEYVKKTKKMRKKAKKLASEAEDSRGKAEAIYNFVQENYAVDSSGYVLRPTQNSLKKVYADKQAAPFEMNILLVEMLKMAGLDA